MFKRRSLAFSWVLLLVSALACAQSSSVGIGAGVEFYPSFATAADPGLMGDREMNLGGQWRFGRGEQPSFGEKIQFGFPPQSRKSGIDEPEMTDEIVWYENDFDFPADWRGALLNFEGIDYQSDIYVNGAHLASHHGAYAPIQVNITEILKHAPITNGKKRITLRIRAQDSMTSREQAGGKQERKNREGSIFYPNSIGAWKTASAREVPDHTYLKAMRMNGDAQGRLVVQAEIGNPAPGARLELRLADEKTGQALPPFTIAADRAELAFSYQAGEVTPWSPAHPALYQVDARITVPASSGANGGENRTAIDHVRSYTGFRTFELRNGFFYLNGQRVYLQGYLNQAEYPESLYSATAEDTRLDLDLIQNSGANSERVHNTTPTKNKLRQNAERGVLMCVELPTARDIRAPEARTRYLEEGAEILQSYAWNAATVAAVLGNEDWGMLEDDFHHAPATDQEREAFHWDLYKLGVQYGPPRLPLSLEDGWRGPTGHAKATGQPVAGIDSSLLLLSAHDYSQTPEDLSRNYAKVGLDPAPGTLLPRNAKELVIETQVYPGRQKLAAWLGEYGGRGFSLNPKAMLYGKPIPSIEDWLLIVEGHIAAAGSIPLFSVGNFYTQLRDVGAVPGTEDERPGEPNGVFDPYGREKLPHELSRLRAAFAEQHRLWHDNAIGYDRLRPVNSCEDRLVP